VFRRKRYYAGLSIEGGAIRYLELMPTSHGFRIARSAKVSVEEDAIA